MQKITCNSCSSQNLPNARFCSSCGHQLPKQVTTAVETPISTEKTPSASRTKLYGALVGALVVVLTAWGVQRMLSMKGGSVDDELMKMASDMNKMCPVMVDAETQLDNAVAIGNSTFQYNYTLVHAEKANVDTNAFKSAMLPTILTQVRTNPQLRKVRDNKVTMNYKYADRKKEHLVIISISPDMYE